MARKVKQMLKLNVVLLDYLLRELPSDAVLVYLEETDEDIRVRLRKTLAKFPHIEEIRVTEGLLGRLLQHRFSGVYSLVLNICQLS